MKKILCFCALAFPGLAHADGIDLFVNDRTISVDYLSVWGGADVGFGALYNTQGDLVVNGSILVFGREQARRTTVEGGLGVKLFGASIPGASVLAAGLGGQLTVFPRSSRFGFGGYGYYAPQILSINSDSLLEIGTRVEFRMFDTASIYLGLHHIAIDTGGSTTTIDDGVHFGINIRF